MQPFVGREPVIELLSGSHATELGGKARHVNWLIASGERVPTTWVIPFDEPIDERSVQALDPSQAYAIRSSANVEDSAVASYAGQFVSELDVPVVDAIAAVERVRASGGSDRVVAYSEHLGSTENIAVSVMIQPMVTPVVSGVAFSRNPITGLNEVVVEAVAGRGDRLVDDGMTPARWIYRWGSWIERPDSQLIDEDLVAEVVAGTERMAAAYGSPIDLEWVWDGEHIWWVQLRPITGLDDVSIYSSRISREVMPGMIKPLVWSVNVPMVNQAWVDLFTEAIGPNDVRPEALAKSFAYRSYFNMGAIGDIFELLGMPGDSLELLLGLPAGDDQPKFKPSPATMRLLPRMLRMGVGKSRYGKSVAAEVRSLRAAYSKFDGDDLSSRSDSALLSDVRALSDIGIRSAYANIVTPLLANLHNALLRKRLASAGFDPESIDIGDTASLEEVNPNPHLDGLRIALADLDSGTIAAIRGDGMAALPDELRARFEDFLERFGHLSASGNDFSVVPWRETPDTVVAMALDHVATHGDAERRRWQDIEPELSALMRPLLRSLRNRTQQFIEHRGMSASPTPMATDCFAVYFLEIGRRLVARGLLEEAEDVMYLYLDEVRAHSLGQPGQPHPMKSYGCGARRWQHSRTL